MVHSSSLLLLALGAFQGSVLAHDVTEIHGSGTTNPSKCYWHIMESIMDRTKEQTRMTYRAVGSSTGIKEFMGQEEENFVQLNHFGSGDIPLNAGQYKSISEKEEMLHLPIVLGAISLFHSIPNVPSGSGGLNMTSCLLARVMKRDIKDWLHPDIVKENPNLENLIGEDKYPIQVARRDLGSSSTSSVTAYLNTGCPSEWPESLVGKEITWDEDTLVCQGSSGMTTCIRQYPGTIGYIDAGHGHSENLVEIELENANGKFISSLQSDDKGGIGKAAEVSEFLPSEATSDFSKVELLNQRGDFTWPIVAMSYIYVRKDWTTEGFLEDDQQALLMAFLQSLYEPAYIDNCKELFGFTPAYTNEKLLKIAMEGLDSIIISDVAKANAYAFETKDKTQAYIGQGDNIISGKRRSNAEYERSQMQTEIESLKTKIEELSKSVTVGARDTEQKVNQALVNSVDNGFTNTDSTNVTISLALSIVSIVLWVLFLAKSLCAPKSTPATSSAPAASTSGVITKVEQSRPAAKVSKAGVQEQMV